MYRKILGTALIIFMQISSVYALEDCVISTDGKLSDISIEHNDVVDVYPIFTIMNEKNTLVVHPLKTGNTRFCVLKNGKQKVMFNVDITKEATKIDPVDGFEIFGIDLPPDFEEFDFELDLPPELGE